jgi:hypothetical protein
MGAAVEAQTHHGRHDARRTPELRDLAGIWPKREAAGGEDAGTAKKLGDTRKIEVSKQELELTWRNSEQLERRDIAAFAEQFAENA